MVKVIKVKKSFGFTSLRYYIIFGLLIGIGIGGFYRVNYMNTPNLNDLFWRTISQNLQTSSVTKTILQGDDNTSVAEATTLQFRAQLLVRTTTNVEKKSPSSISSVTTESVGTTTKDFARYTKLFSSYHGGLNNQINKWANGGQSDAEPPTFLLDALYSTPLMFGYLSTSQQNTLVAQLQSKNVYSFNSLGATKGYAKNGIAVYDYQVTINWNEYTAIYKQYLAMIGLESQAYTIVGPTEPTLYKAVISINPQALQIVGFRLLNGAYTEQIYSNYDTSITIKAPQKAEISITELQENIKEQVK